MAAIVFPRRCGGGFFCGGWRGVGVLWGGGASGSFLGGPQGARGAARAAMGGLFAVAEGEAVLAPHEARRPLLGALTAANDQQKLF